MSLYLDAVLDACAPDTMQSFLTTLEELIKKNYRHTVVYNNEARSATIVSITKVDFIKRDFPDFYIYLNAHGQKQIEKVFTFA